MRRLRSTAKKGVVGRTREKNDACSRATYYFFVVIKCKEPSGDMQLLGPHPQSVSFYLHMILTGCILVLLLYLLGTMVGVQRSNSFVENTTRVMTPLAIMFAGLAVALAIRITRTPR